MDSDANKKIFVDKYISIGEHGFYKFLIGYAIAKLLKIKDKEYSGVSPELEYLNYSEKFLFYYRRESEDIYLALSNIFRKAGNKIYRMMLKSQLTIKNTRFLNVV